MHNLDIVALFLTFLVTNMYCKNLSQSEVDHGNSSYSRKIKGGSVAGRTMDVKSYETLLVGLPTTVLIRNCMHVVKFPVSMQFTDE